MAVNNKFSNVALMLLGILLIAVCLPSVIRREYVWFRPEGFAEGGPWLASAGFLVVSFWFFLIGLIGLIREKKG
jgi:hypothetical protein